MLGAGLFAGCASLSGRTPADMEQAASARSPVIGKPAPEFTLADAGGGEQTLAGLRGKWVVLYFYPSDDTPGCTCQATQFTKLLKAFRDLNAEVIGVSEDSPEVHRKFTEKYRLALTLLSDPDHRVMRAYGAWVDSSLGPFTYGRVVRSTFVIDPTGIIRYHWPEVIPEGHADRVRARLAELQAAGGSSP